MTPEQLSSIGQALYGSRWKTALANEIGRDPITVWRWANSKNAKKGIPEAAARKILRLAEARNIALV